MENAVTAKLNKINYIVRVTKIELDLLLLFY